MWSGSVVIRQGWTLFRGAAGDQTRHRHHAVQVVIGIDSLIEVWSEAGGSLWVRGAVIAADSLHRFASSAEPVIMLYVEPELDVGRALDGWCAGTTKPLSAAQGDRIAGLLGDPAAADDEALGRLEHIVLGSSADAVRAGTMRDERIERSIAALPRPVPRSVSLAAMAKSAGLSAGRYAHLFRDHTGLPLRPYLRWLRLQEAMNAIARGSSLTDAAHQAGFSDSAHLSRTFRRTFGVAPSDLLNLAVRAQTG